MLKAPKFFLFTLFVLLFFVSCRQPSTPRIGFYYWKTHFALGDVESKELDSLFVKDIYLRLFDLDTVRTKDQRLVVAPLAGVVNDSRWPDSIIITPVIYITRSAMLQSISLDTLASRTASRIQQMMQGHPYHEVQWDMDWTPLTRDRYFSFLSILRKQAVFQGKKFTATLRLHQLKYQAKCGIPPVDEVFLMCYHLGNETDYQEKNSLFSVERLREYLRGFTSYPLPINISLPLFQRTLIFRNHKLLALLNERHIGNWQQDKHLISLGDDRYRVKQSFFCGQQWLLAGDELREESVKINELKEAILLLRKNNIPNSHQILFYHLDANCLQNISAHDLQKLLESH